MQTPTSEPKITLRGHVEVTQINADGSRQVLFSGPNTIMLVGLQALARTLNNEAVDNNRPRAIAVGTGSANNGSNAQTALGAEIRRKAFTGTSYVSSSGTINGVRWDALYDADADSIAGQGLNECGLFTAPTTTTGGTLIAREVFGGTITPPSGSQLIFSWTLTLAEAP